MMLIRLVENFDCMLSLYSDWTANTPCPMTIGVLAMESAEMDDVKKCAPKKLRHRMPSLIDESKAQQRSAITLCPVSQACCHAHNWQYHLQMKKEKQPGMVLQLGQLSILIKSTKSISINTQVTVARKRRL